MRCLGLVLAFLIGFVCVSVPAPAEAGPLRAVFGRVKAGAGKVFGVQRRQERRANRQAARGC